MIFRKKEGCRASGLFQMCALRVASRGLWRLAAGGLILVAPALAIAQETIFVPPAGRASWHDLVEANAARAVEASAERKLAVPFMSAPAPRDLGPPSMPALGPSAPLEFSTYVPSPLGPTVGTGFQAMPDVQDESGFFFIPPDTMGAAGPNHLMTMLNSHVRIQNKTGGVLSTMGLSIFWSPVTDDPFDPRLIYDSIHGRWIAACDANGNSATSTVCFAISDNSDPAGSWTFYSFVADATGDTWADFPGFGVNTTWIAITNNMFTVASFPFSPAFVNAKMWVIDKSTALVPGGPLTVTVFPPGFDVDPGFGTDGFALQPCVTFGSEPTLYIADGGRFSSGGTALLRLSQITGTGASPSWSVVPGSTFSGTGLFFVVNNFNFSQINAAQLGTTARVSTNDPRLSSNAVFRNGGVWCTHSGGLPVPGTANRTAVFWYQLNPAAMPNPIVQSGVLDGGSGVHHFFPSIAVNKNDDAFLGFSRSHSAIYVQAAYTARFGTDPAGTMDAISLLKAGEDSYVKDFGSGSIRWGDYSATVVDPTDDASFWTIQEYAALDVGPNPSDDRWGTWWGGAVAASCSDGIQNQGEDLIDCGGPCPACTCLVNGDCADGAFCTGTETCDAHGECVAGTFPCAGNEWCNDVSDTCVAHGNGDFEPDGDHDLQDFATFQVCRDESALVAGCAPANLTGTDETIDLDDFAEFAGVLGGPN